MGMAAGQARLLSITARMTDNEMRSQLITNSKLRLADSSSEASSEYMQALNSSELTYLFYDDTGAKKAQNLTAGILMNFSELKTQYGLVNSSGQLMVSSTDKVNYEKSENLSEFLACYDVPLTDNPKYDTALKSIYGKNVEGLHDEDNIYKWSTYFENLSDRDLQDINTLLAKDAKDFTEDDYNKIIGYTTTWQQSVINNSNGTINDYKKLEGIFGKYVNELLTPPGIGFPNINDFRETTGSSELAEKFELASKECYKNAMNGSSGCYLHVLAQLIDLKQSDITETQYGHPAVNSEYGHEVGTTLGDKINTKGQYNGSAIQSSGQLTNMAEVSEYICNPDNNAMAAYDPSDATTTSSSKLDKLLSNYKFDADGNKVLKTFREKVIDLYYVVENRNNADALGGQTIAYNDLLPYLEKFDTDMKESLTTEFNEAKYYQAIDDTKKQLQDWVNNTKFKKENYKTELDNLPPQQVPDENDPKYEWYKNLWYRMGGISETKKSDNSNAYKELDSTLMNNSEWLQFALEHGVLSLEQVNFSQDGSDKYPNIGDCDWVSIQYKNAADISSQQNDLKIAKAEVKYKNALTDIENQDKKYDQDLKKLDTEHNALQTEYDSVKGVIEKNVERSFKAFS